MIGDIRGLLSESDNRFVLRLIPDMGEVCRGYTLAYLGDTETIAKQVWILNATDWMRGKNEISWSLYNSCNDNGFYRVLHEFALKLAENLLVSHKKQAGEVLEECWALLQLKRRWVDGEASNKELDRAIIACWDAHRAAEERVNVAVSRVAYWAGDRDAYFAASRAGYWDANYAATRAASWDVGWAEKRKQHVELFADMLEDSVGIERGVEEKTLDSKVLAGDL